MKQSAWAFSAIRTRSRKPTARSFDLVITTWAPEDRNCLASRLAIAKVYVFPCILLVRNYFYIPHHYLSHHARGQSQ